MLTFDKFDICWNRDFYYYYYYFDIFGEISITNLLSKFIKHSLFDFITHYSKIVKIKIHDKKRIIVYLLKLYIVVKL